MSGWLSLKEAIAILVIIAVVNVVGLWAIDFFQTEIRLVGHRGVVLEIAFVDRQQLVATACSDGKLRLFSTPDGKLLREITGHSDSLTDVTSYREAEDVATASADGTIKIWKVHEGIQRRSIAAHQGTVLAAKYSDDGSVLVSIGTDRALRVWTPTSGERIQEIVVRYDFACVTVNFMGSIAASNGPESDAVIWNLKTGKELHRLSGQRGAIVSLAFNSDGSRLVTGRNDGVLQIYDTSNGKQLHLIDENHRRVNDVKFTQDDHAIMVATSDGTLQLWDMTTGKKQRSLLGDRNEVLCVATSPQHLIATGSRDRTATLWRIDLSDAER